METSFDLSSWKAGGCDDSPLRLTSGEWPIMTAAFSSLKN